MRNADEELADVPQRLEISEATCFRWRNGYRREYRLGGMKSEEAKRLKQSETEKARLKKLLAEAEVDKAILKGVALGNF